MNIITRRHILGLICLILVGARPTPTLPVELVRDQGSEFVIYHHESAPTSVAMAASERHEYLSMVSGTKLEIVHQPPSPMSCSENV